MPEAGAAPPGLAQCALDLPAGAAGLLDEDTPTALRHEALVAQVRLLAQFIRTARSEIASVRVDDILAQHLPAAADELDAIVLHTAEATGLILDGCERLELMVESDPLRGAVTETTARIYEACSFQDITGQRVVKVVHTLKTIEAKVTDMLRVFGCAPQVAAPPAGHAGLLNGPQRIGLAMEQREIDALLEAFE